MSTTITCNIPVQVGNVFVQEGCTAVFSSSGILLTIEGLPLGQSAPDDFDVELEGMTFSVRSDGDEHVIRQEHLDAFTAMVFG